MHEQARNVIIGVFVLAAICLAVWLILFLHPTVGDGEKILRVRFANIEKINIGSRVTFAGKPVGQVIAINQIFDARDQPTDRMGRVYFYELVLAVDSSVKVYNTDEIVIHTSGLFGERTVAIVPKVAPPGVKSELISNQAVYAASGDQMQDVIDQLAKVTNKMSTTLDLVNGLLETNYDNITEAIVAMRNAMTSMDQTFEQINELDVIPSFKEAATNLSSVFARIDKKLEYLDERKFWDNVSTTFANVADISADINEGNGTLGRLIKSDELYLRTLSIFSKGETVMNDINHYGILFHLDKKWQRERARQMNLLCRLRSPKAFKRYFECEIDRVSTSLSRVNILLEKARCCGSLLKNPCFTEEFGDLLRQVKHLEDRLEMYNQQLIELNQ